MDIPTPYYKVHIDRIHKNLNGPVKMLRNEANCKVMLALKGFSCPPVLSLMSEGIDGVSASGLYEAILGRCEVGKHVFTYSPAFKNNEIDQVSKNSTAVTFNSEKQYRQYRDIVYSNGASCGIRINPECSTLPETFKANPCKPFSRLGITRSQMPNLDEFGPGRIEGILIHTMCEQNADALTTNVDYLISNYDQYLKRIQWLNLGGGQLISKDDYSLEQAITAINKLHSKYDFEVFLEPCEGLLTNSCYFVASVIDIIQNQKTIAIIDGSAICHVPDVAYVGWKRAIVGASFSHLNYDYIIGGCSCYASDIWGEYSFEEPLSIGDHIVFSDIAAYSIVKGNFFNGLVMPSVVVSSKETGDVVVRSFGYNDFVKLQ